MSTAIEEKYTKIGKILNSTGQGAYPISAEYLGILKIAIAEENLDFLTIFDGKMSQTMDQLKESLASKNLNYSEDEILKKIKALGDKGILLDQPNSKGVMVIRIMPPFRIFEYIFMKELEDTDEINELARLQHIIEERGGKNIQENYDDIAKKIAGMHASDRTVISSYVTQTSGEDINIIIDETIEEGQEVILPAQTVKEIIDKYDDIAVGQCYCRNHKKALGGSCAQTHVKDSCFTLGKSARHTAKHGFARLISKEEALELLEKVRDDGLVFKAYHYQGNPNKREDAICCCCNDCCTVSRGYAKGPRANATNYKAQINSDLCTGCATCVDACHNLIIEINDDGIAEIQEEKYCIGCGVCAFVCPENAISMVKTKLRTVVIMPQRK